MKLNESNEKLKAAGTADKFNTVLKKLENLLIRRDLPETLKLCEKLQLELKQYYDLGFLTVAFVGQYSAGKSTIISALTGRRDVRIGADITTDKTTTYDWNNIKLIDTPGLFTERQDHDDITYEAIRQADLLVFCLTYMLFDSVTVENFKKLAYELGYRWKMMLVVNKMSDGAGEEEQLIANYRESLKIALKPYDLSEFPLCFIDAKDYCEGIDENDEMLLEISRFPTLTSSLNAFIEQRGSLARLDTPIRIALSYLDEAHLAVMRDSNEDSAFFELLNRFSRAVRLERDRLRTRIASITLELSAAVANEGTILAEAVGDENIEALGKSAERNVQKHCEQAQEKMEEALQASVEFLQEEVKKVLESDLAKAFFERLGTDRKVSATNAESNVDWERLRNQANRLKGIGEQVGNTLFKLANKGSASTGQVFLRASTAAGSNLHKGVYTMGKLLGVNFRPWQAVNIAKNIGNVAKFVGPLLSVASLGVDIAAAKQEEESDRKLAEARREITSQFIAMAKEIEAKVEIQLREFESQLFGDVENKIAESRQQEEKAIVSSNEWVAEIVELRKELKDILTEISYVR